MKNLQEAVTSYTLHLFYQQAAAEFDKVRQELR